MSYWDGNVWVCVDCYFAHHYGAHKFEGQWYSGESDEPCEGGEPLRHMDNCELADNTCPEHELQETGEIDEFDDPIEKCPHCGSDEHENGIDEFSMDSCDGCGSHLGGSRYRLAYKVNNKEKEASNG